MRVLICGGRHFDNASMMEEMFGWLATLEGGRPGEATIVHGGARGADRMADQMAMDLGYDVEEFPAQWDRYGRAAGPIRNQEMLDSGIDMVVPMPGGRGTEDMIKRATRAGVIVFKRWWNLQRDDDRTYARAQASRLIEGEQG